MSRQSRPAIGVNADLIAASKFTMAHLRLGLGYVDCIVAAGGLPIIVPPFKAEIDLDDYLDQVDGFVLTGAVGDLDPRKHGLPTHQSVQLLPERRDDSDRLLVRKLIERRMPILAIGLGMQQLNVALNGTLFMHLPEEMPRCLPHRDPDRRGGEERPGHPHRHTATIEVGTRFEEIYGPGEIRVNSSHHQAVRQPGKGLQVAVRAPDGVVEAVEATDMDWFCIGVQWHPEAESATALDMQLFECLVQASLRTESARLVA